VFQNFYDQKERRKKEDRSDVSEHLEPEPTLVSSTGGQLRKMMRVVSERL